MMPTARNKAWTDLMDEFEYVPELMWPLSVAVNEQMRTDSQLAALYGATVLTVQNWKWTLDPNGAEDALVERIAKDYNLPINGDDPKPKGRQKNRFTFHQHLHRAFRALIYGHQYFEQYGKIGDDGKWHVRRLQEIPPRTIANIKVASDGGLISVSQNIFNGYTPLRQPWDLPEIPVDRLLAYIWEQEGGNWFGRSIFRECYKNWLIKDRLMRIDAINHERAGGVPIGIAAPGSLPSDVDKVAQMASEFKQGEGSGAGLPPGADLKILRAAGSDVVGSMRYHDESMARRFLLMVMQLGQNQVGSRALGTTFVDFFSRGLDFVGQWAADTFNEFQLEDDVDWNEGEETELVPRLAFEHDPEIDFQALATLVDAEVIRTDNDLEDAVRKEMGLTKRGRPRKRAKDQKALPTATKPAQDPGAPDPSQAQEDE